MRKQSSSPAPSIEKEIQANKVHPVYLLYGEEDFLIENTLKQMLSALLDNPSTRDFNLDYLDGLTASINDVLSAVEAYPIMSKWRVVVVREPTIVHRRKETLPIDLLRSAIDRTDGDSRKSISIMLKALNVSAQDIINQSNDFNNAVTQFIEETKGALKPSELAFLQNLPQIARNLGELSDVSTSTQDLELLIEWLNGELPTSSVLILTVKGNIDARSRLVKTINRVGKCVSFQPLETGRAVQQDPLFQSVCRKLRTVEKKITPPAFNLLRDRTGNDMRKIFEAIEKIIGFIGNNTQIDEEHVRDLVTQSNFENIFALTNAIGSRRLSQAMKSLHSILKSGEPPIKVNALIARQIRLALQAKLLVERERLSPAAGRASYQNFTNTIFKPLASKKSNSLPQNAQFNLLEQNPYAAYKIFQCVPFFSTSELIEGLEKTLDADKQLKGSYLTPECILEELVHDLCQKRNARKTL